MEPLGPQRGALQDAEAVLLVDDREPQLAERDSSCTARASR
jgi:hypothetical protein